LEVTITVVDTASLNHRLYLPQIIQGKETGEACTELLANGGAETNEAWEFVGGWPGDYSSSHVRSGDQAIRLGIETAGDDGYLYSSVQQTVRLPANATQLSLSFWRYPTSSNPDDDRAYLALLDSGGGLLDTLWLATSDNRTWQPATFDLTAYRGQTIMLRFSVLNKSSPGVTADWLDDISLASCGS
jgi:hypothetical protein